jgi:hypothetical protein
MDRELFLMITGHVVRPSCLPYKVMIVRMDSALTILVPSADALMCKVGNDDVGPYGAR